MRLATIKRQGKEIAGIVTGKGVLPVAAVNAAKGTAWAEDMMSLIQKQQIPGLTKWYNAGGKEEIEMFHFYVLCFMCYFGAGITCRTSFHRWRPVCRGPTTASVCPGS